jgi:O-acetyl-ADP-ribose deacetylase (regulator of RNase III)
MIVNQAAGITKESQVNTLLREHEYPGGWVLQIVQGDLTEEVVDAIVNAANSQLQHGGGVAGAIVRRGGMEIQKQSDAWVRQHGLVSPAEPAYTEGGSLPCKYVIHAVGPVWGEGNEDAKLADAIAGSLRLADSLGLTSIAFPAVSTGIFGFPKERAAYIIIQAILHYLNNNPTSSLKQVRLTLFDQPTIQAFTRAWEAEGLDD